MIQADERPPPPKPKQKPWPMEEALRIIDEYAADLRETIKKLRRRLLQ